jgi:hypothetical protein
MSPPAPPTTLADFINMNQDLQRALLEMGKLDSQLSASTPANGGMGDVPGGTFLVNGVAISWKSNKQPYMSAAANIDKKRERELSDELTASTNEKSADGAAVEEEAGTPSAKAPARKAARRPREFLQEGSFDIKNFTDTNNMINTAAGEAPDLTAG